MIYDLYGLKKGDVEVLYLELNKIVPVSPVGRISDHYGEYYSYDLNTGEKICILLNWFIDDENHRVLYKEFQVLIKIEETQRPQYWEALLKEIFPEIELLEREEY
ncbi:MAG: hypothetical protein HQM15_00300 [Deltaproteobacteria bacterium]|nr:hypothetical protein [Deltaproteobacteria bacterium]